MLKPQSPHLATLALGVSLLPAVAFAEITTVVPGLSFSGDINVQFANADLWNDNTLNTDMQLVLRPISDNEVDFGLELSVISTTSAKDHWTDYTLWGGLVIGFEGVDVRVGAPRPVTKTMALLPELGHNVNEEVWYDYVLGSRTLQYSILSDQMFTPGVSVQSTGDGPFQWGLSMHQLIDRDFNPMNYHYYNHTMIEAVGQYNMGNLTVAGQLVMTNYDGEFFNGWGGSIEQEEDTNVSAMLSARYAKDNWVLGINGGRHNSWWGPTNFVRLHGSYIFDNGISITADHMYEYYPNSDWHWNVDFVGVSYSFANGMYVKGGTSHWNDGSHAESLTVGYKF